MKKLITLVLAMVCAAASWAASRAEFAYALSATQEGNTATFSFKVTGDVTDSRIILTSTSSWGTVEIPVGAVTVSETKSVDYDMSALVGNYTWSVEVSSPAIESSSRFVDIKDGRTTAFRGGVVCITDPESDAYGYTVIASAKGKGFMVFDQTGTKVGEGYQPSVGNTSHASSPYRGGQLDGKAIFSDYSDAYSAYYVFDPLNPETTVSNLLAAEGFSRITSSSELSGTGYTAGIWNNGTTYSGGNATSAAFYKDADGTHLITFGEDIGNKLVRYTLDANGMISSAPDKEYTAATALLGSKNCDVITTEYGFFASNLNAVTDGTGNTEAKPAFIFCDYEGNVKFNSSTITNLTSSYSAIAVTKDLDMIAVLGHSAENSGNLRLLFYSVTWTNGVPSFTQVNAFPIPTATATVGWASLRFDPAGNLWAYFDHYGYRGYGLQNAAPKATTPAKAANTVAGTAVTCDTRAMAYDLDMQVAGDNFVFTYYLSADAQNVTFVFTDNESNTKTYDLGVQSAGSNQHTIAISDFEGKDWLWSVAVTAYPSANYAQLAKLVETANYGGVIPVTDPNSTFFGYTLVALGANGGYKLYTPKFTASSTGNPNCFGSTTTTGSPWRGTFFDGNFYVANDDATTSGIYFTVPSELGVATQLFSGTRDEATGNFTLEDGTTTVSGRTSCVAFQGSGENTKLYTFDRINNKVVCYAIGEETSIKVAPTIFADASAKLLNKDVDIITTENGFFASQVRSSGNQNTAAPAFIYCNNEGTILYNAGEHSDIIPSCSGIALNAQGDRLAV
ncbi:MAG: hypothetical protein ACI4AM_05665, partial [Muribaculaceae bacterium]